jgi:hypothetical protein
MIVRHRTRPARLCGAIALLFVLALPAAADEAADHHAAAAALLEQLHPTDAINAMMPNIINGLRINLTHNDPDLVKSFDAFAPALAAEAEASKSDLIDKIVDVYANTFTTDELKTIEAFYKSPTGAKMIATQGQVTTDTINVVRDWGTKLARQLGDEARTKLQSRQP